MREKPISAKVQTCERYAAEKYTEDSLQANHDRDENLINGATEVIPPFEGGQISIKPK